MRAKLLALVCEARREKKERLQGAMEQAASASGSDQPVGEVPVARGKKTLLDRLMDSDSDESSSDKEHSQEREDDMLRKEVEMYFDQESGRKKEKNFSPLQWWKKNEERFPNIALLARSYLAVPATSTPSERLFSAAGNIVSKKRASLTPAHVDMLTFLHFNA